MKLTRSSWSTSRLGIFSNLRSVTLIITTSSTTTITNTIGPIIATIMVFVPWGDHGICKFWMLRPDRCYNGDKCRFRHPPDADRGRLWDEQLAAQAARHARSNDISPPPLSPSTLHSRRARDSHEGEHETEPTSTRSYQFKGKADNDRLSSLDPSTESPFNQADERRISDSVNDRSQQSITRKRSPSTNSAEGGNIIRHRFVGRDDFRPAAQFRINNEHEHRRSQVQLEQGMTKDDFVDVASQDHVRSGFEPDHRHDKVTPFQRRRELTTNSRIEYERHAHNPHTLWDEQSKHEVAETANPPPLRKRDRMRDYTADNPGTSDTSISASLPETGRSFNPEQGKSFDVHTSVYVGDVQDGEGTVAAGAEMEAPAAHLSQLSRDQMQHLDLHQSRLVTHLQSRPPITMGATKRLSNGEAKVVGPHPSAIRVAAPYTSEAVLEKKLQPATLDSHDKSLAEAREENIKLQGMAWLDTTRRSLQLPIRTFTTACVYYHKFRLAHSGIEYNWVDATAASLLTSCKVEDTLKKSKDILAAAYNAKASGLEQVGSDDPIFEGPSRVVIGLERLVLEAGGFDFRSRYPHRTMVKIARTLPASEESNKVAKVAYTILTDMHRIFAPLKQTSATLALASLELSAHLAMGSSAQHSSEVRDQIQAIDLQRWSTTREVIMETLLDTLDLYTHHTSATILGTRYNLDEFLRVRLSLNKECTEFSLPRYTTAPEPSLDRISAVDATLRVSNGHPTPVSPPRPDSQTHTSNASNVQSIPETTGTLRFMLNPSLAVDEQAEVRKYFVEEWEDYDEEVEIPIPRTRMSSRERERPRDLMDRRPADLLDDRRGPSLPPAREERLRDRAIDRDRMRYERRYDDRDRRIDDRRDRRHHDRRYDDDRRRRDDRR
nr:ctd kinase subunit beta [Quercus suber]